MKGIYAIRNTLNGKHYVGSTSVSISGRFKSHRYQLRHGKHHSPALQRSWDKNGEAAFEFKVIEEVENLDLILEREQYWIESLSASSPANGYNVAPVAGTRSGVPQPEEMKERYRKERKGVPKTEEHKRNISEGQKGKVLSDDHRRKISAAAKAQWADPVQREAQSKRRKGSVSAFKGRTHSEETKAVLSEKAKGRRDINIANLPVMTDEIKAKLRAINIGRKASDESRARMSESRKGNPGTSGWKHSEEWKKNHSEALKGRSRPDKRRPSNDLVVRMKELRATGISYAKIAVEVGKDVATVHRYINK